jgi:hypothetical protein
LPGVSGQLGQVLVDMEVYDNTTEGIDLSMQLVDAIPESIDYRFLIKEKDLFLFKK